jgi:hypothetical protein
VNSASVARAIELQRQHEAALDQHSSSVAISCAFD